MEEDQIVTPAVDEAEEEMVGEEETEATDVA